jgi:adenine-specific DNA glycosylase
MATLSEILRNLGLKHLKQAANLDLTIPSLTPWRIHSLKHTFTHYHLQWTVWAITVDSSFNLPAPWQYVAWHSVKTVGVPKAVLKVLAV